MKQKLHSRRGETLAEVLVSMLIVALAALLLAAMVAAAGDIDRSARRRDEEFYEQLTAAETHDGTSGEKTGRVQVVVKPAPGTETRSTFPVKIYGDGLTSYLPDPEGVAGP